jgi:hypothetical protein
MKGVSGQGQSSHGNINGTVALGLTDGRIAQVSDPLIPNQLFSYSYLPSSNLLSAVVGPIHTVTNIWEPNRDVLDIKQNKVGSTVISNYDYAVNALGQRTGKWGQSSRINMKEVSKWGQSSRINTLITYC